MNVDFDKLEANANEKVAAEKKAVEEELKESKKSFSPDPKLWITFAVIAVLLVGFACYVQFFM